MNPSFFFPVEIPFKEKERMSGKSKLNLVSMKSLDVLILKKLLDEGRSPGLGD